MSSFYTDARVRESAKKSSPKKTAGKGTGTSKPPAKAATTSRTTPVKAATTTSRTTPMTQPVESAEPKSEPTPTPTPAMEKRVVQPEGREEYQAIPGKLSTGTAPIFPVREQERKLSAEREDLLRQAAALETPLGRTVVPAGTEGMGRTVTYETYAPAIPRDDLQDPAPTVGRAAGLDYRAARGDPRVLQTQPKGSVLSPQTAPDKPVNPDEELTRLMEPAPSFYVGATAVQSPYSEETTRLAGGREVNVSIPVMAAHAQALETELKKPQTPEREAELRRDLERAEAILKQQRAYMRALQTSGMQPIEEQQRAAEKLMGTR